MYGYVYLTTNIVNGRKYIGQHKGEFDPAYIGSGTVLRRAIRKYGRDNFSLEVLCEYSTKEALNAGELHFIALFEATASENYYNLAAGGCGGDTWASKSPEERSAIGLKIWNNLTDEQKAARSEKIRAALKGKTKSDSHKEAISASKKGKPRNWSDETEKKYSERRKSEIAQGINVPPKGNAGNKDFRHKEETKQILRQKARENINRLIDERGSYISEQGKVARDEKIASYYTPERRAEHAKKIAEGRKRAKEARGET